MKLGGSTTTKSRPKTKSSSKTKSESNGSKKKSKKLSTSSKYGTDKDVKPSVGRGWGDVDKMRKQTSGFTPSLKLTEEDQIVKFLDDNPVAVFIEHWVTRSHGKRSWVCMTSVNDPKTGRPFKKCPLCDSGNQDRNTRVIFNVVTLDESGATPWVLETNATLQAALIELAKDKRKGPLTRHYYAMKKIVGKDKTKPQYPIQVVKERDLKDDWDIKPLSEAKLEKLIAKQTPQHKVMQIPTMQQMRELVRNINGEDEDDTDDNED